MERLLWYTLPLLLLHASAAARESKIAPDQSHDIWDAAAGFPPGYVYSITQSADGYLWIGTSKGLVRYDGLSFVTIRERSPNTASALSIVGLVTDSNDQLWATDDHTHLFRYAVNGLVGPLPDNGKHQHRAAAVSLTRDGWLLFASELQGLIEYERGRAHVLLDPSKVPPAPTAVAQTPDGTFWIGTRDAGVFRLDVTRQAPELQHVAGLPYEKINCLLPVAASTLLLGTDKGLLSLHNGTLIQEEQPELRNLEILALAGGREGDVWIGAAGHLFRANAKEIAADGRIHSLDHLAVRFPVTSLFEDRAGDLWIGGPECIERYRVSGFTTYLSSAGLSCDNCGSIYVDDQGNAWFAPWDGGLVRLSHDSIEQIKLAGLTDDTVYSIAGGAGEIWLGRKYGGVTRFRLREGTIQASTYTRRNGLAQDSVYSIYRAPDGTVWAGTLNEGVSRLRAGRWHTFTSHDGLPSNTISVITGNAAGELFVGTPNGLAGLKNNRWASYSTHDGLPPGAIESLFLDEAGTLWIGSEKGIAYLQSGTAHVPVNAPDALYGEILGIAESNGWLWITTGNHVLRVRCSALLNDSFAAGDYREFGVTDGLPSVEGVKRSRSVVKDNRGWIWLSLNQGISVLEPSVFARPAFPVMIRLEGMLVDGKPITPGASIHVPTGKHRLTFEYAGVNVSNPEAVRYRYRLENQDSSWSEPTALRRVDYTNTPPGQYQFQVVARNPDGIWSPHESTMVFDVEPAYYQTLWFGLMCSAALLLFLWALYRYRLHQIALEFDTRMQERTRIARELHDTLLQSFHGLLFRFQAARNMLPRRLEDGIEALDGALDTAEQAIAEGRDAIQDLRSGPAVQSDLAQLLNTTGQDLARSQELNSDSATFRVTEEGDRQDLSPILQDEVYRIAREVMRNAFRHARAHQIEAEIRYDDRWLRLRIRDDGTGIEPRVLQQGGRAGHWGLLGIRERAKRIGARLDFWSEAGAGTEVELTIPASVAYGTSHKGPAFRLFRKKSRSHEH